MMPRPHKTAPIHHFATCSENLIHLFICWFTVAIWCHCSRMLDLSCSNRWNFPSSVQIAWRVWSVSVQSRLQAHWLHKSVFNHSGLCLVLLYLLVFADTVHIADVCEAIHSHWVWTFHLFRLSLLFQHLFYDVWPVCLQHGVSTPQGWPQGQTELVLCLVD